MSIKKMLDPSRLTRKSYFFPTCPVSDEEQIKHNTWFGEGYYIYEDGLKLVLEYYKKKYAIADIFLGQGYYDFCNVIKQKKTTTEDFRFVYLYQLSRHIVPIFYLKEADNEIILIAESLGKSTTVYTDLALYFLYTILPKSFPNIPIYSIAMPRQIDQSSCYTDALVFIRDIMAQHENKFFKSPQLVKKLMSRAVKEEASNRFYTVLLPDELLKTAQSRRFFTAHHQASDDPIVHIRRDGISESIIQFRSRYSNTDTDESLNTYLRKQSVRYAKIVIIQFYKKELERELMTICQNEDLVLQLVNTFSSLMRGSNIPMTDDDYFHCTNSFFIGAQTAFSQYKEECEIEDYTVKIISTCEETLLSHINSLNLNNAASDSSASQAMPA
jgi:hypothetical protein